MMKYYIYIVLAISLLMTSCATLLNSPYKNITIYTTETSEIIYEQETVSTESNKADLTVERKRDPIQITAVTDSLTKTFEVKSKNSFMYWCNIVSNYGLGMFIDKDSPKRYSYPSRIYINSADTVGRYFRYGQSNNKGEFYLHLSLPHINSFRLTPEDEGAKINTGFWGINVGLDYYHSKGQFINLGVSGVLDFFVPVPAAVDIIGDYELMRSEYISLSNNHRLKRFSLGYGLSYARNTWDFRYYDRFDPPPPTREPVDKSHNAIGLIFPTYFQCGDRFYIGLIYRPTFLRPALTKKFQYEHLISIDFAWKIRLKK